MPTVLIQFVAALPTLDVRRAGQTSSAGLVTRLGSTLSFSVCMCRELLKSGVSVCIYIKKAVKGKEEVRTKETPLWPPPLTAVATVALEDGPEEQRQLADMGEIARSSISLSADLSSKHMSISTCRARRVFLPARLHALSQTGSLQSQRLATHPSLRWARLQDVGHVANIGMRAEKDLTNTVHRVFSSLCAGSGVRTRIRTAACIREVERSQIDQTTYRITKVSSTSIAKL